MVSSGVLFLPIGEDVPILITFGLEDSSSSDISLTLDDLPKRITLGLEDEVKLELGPEEVKVPVLESDGTRPYCGLEISSYTGNRVVEELPNLVTMGLDD